MVKKSDQCRAILAASALFIRTDENSVESLEPEIVKCFRKCVKISSSLLDNALQLQLYVEILSHLTLYVKYSNTDINDLIGQLVSQINERRQEAALPELMAAQYNNTLIFLKKNGLDIATIDAQ